MKKPVKQNSINFFNTFCTPKTKYFGACYIGGSETEFADFFSDKEQLHRSFRHLCLFLESAEVLKRQAKKSKPLPQLLPSLLSKQLWYNTVLLLIVGLVDQCTKKEYETNQDGESKLKSLGNRLQIVMSHLNIAQQNDFKTSYFSDSKNFRSFSDVVKHIYESRNFFAHDFEKTYNNTPSDTSLSISADKRFGVVLRPNLSHGRIFIYMLIALVKYLGYPGTLVLKTTKKYRNIGDLISDEA